MQNACSVADAAVMAIVIAKSTRLERFFRHVSIDFRLADAARKMIGVWALLEMAFPFLPGSIYVLQRDVF
jgi:hypothetical protein